MALRDNEKDGEDNRLEEGKDNVMNACPSGTAGRIRERGSGWGQRDQCMALWNNRKDGVGDRLAEGKDNVTNAWSSWIGGRKVG